MLNQVILVGRIGEDIELKKDNNGNNYTNLTLAVPRPFKNEEGISETDFIPCTVYGEIAKHTSEYCKKGDIIGVKGRLQTKDINLQDDKKRKVLQVIAEKVTFLASYKN